MKDLLGKKWGEIKEATREELLSKAEAEELRKLPPLGVCGDLELKGV